jgi:hypothetical protein
MQHAVRPTGMAVVQECTATEEKELEAAMHVSLLVLPATALHNALQEHAEQTRHAARELMTAELSRRVASDAVQHCLSEQQSKHNI